METALVAKEQKILEKSQILQLVTFTLRWQAVRYRYPQSARNKQNERYNKTP